MKRGDHVEFTEVNNKLVLTSTTEIFERKTTITALEPTLLVIWCVLLPAYTSGYDEIKLIYTDKKALPIIEANVANLIGFEIVETGVNFVIIKAVSKVQDDEFDTVLKRAFTVYKQISQVLKEIFETKDLSRLSEMQALEFTLNKCCLFLMRTINRTGYKYPHYMYNIVTFLELAGDHLDYIRRYYVKNPKSRIHAAIAAEYALVDQLIGRIYDLYYDYTPDRFRWIANEQPHFAWFEDMKEFELRHNFKMSVEYLVLMAREIQALHT